MGKSEYIKDIKNRLWGKFNKKIFGELSWKGLLITWAISSIVILWISPLELLSILIGAIIPIVYTIILLLKWRWSDIPKEIYDERTEILEKYNPKNLKLNISHAPNPIYKNGKPIFAATLLIKSEETVKILELRAMISHDHFFYKPKTEDVSSYGVDDALLYFIEGKQPKQITDLRPGDKKMLGINEICEVTLSDGEKKRAAIMASNPVLTSEDLCKESIFQITIILQGKLEGEFIYKSYIHEDMVYAKPEANFITFLDKHTKSIIKMPEKLRARGLKKVELLDTPNENEK
mgnify:CR=1 FL=1|jgi:hypothetical protein